QVERALALLDEAAGTRNFSTKGRVRRLVDGQLVVADLDIRAFLALEAADRLVFARDVERAAGAEVEGGRRVDRPTDAHRTAKDVRHALERIVAHEGQRAVALLVEHAIA